MRNKVAIRLMVFGRSCRGAALAAFLIGCGPALAADAPPAARYEIRQPAQPLAELLQAIARQTGSSLLFDPAVVHGLTSPSVMGRLSAEEAVAKALQGTGLVVTVQRDGALVVKPGATPARSGTTPPPPATSSPSSARPAEEPARRMAQVGGSAATDAGASPAADTPAAPSPQKIEVTGSRLRRVETEGALPVNVYNRADIERSGQPSLGQFLASLNEASMGQGEGSFSGAAQGQGTVQLRGLPLGSTLVLINGRRVQAVGSSSANFFNLT